jgi:hypothetical protein
MARDFTTYKTKFRIRKSSFLPMEWVYELCAYFKTNRHYSPIQDELQTYIIEANCHYREVRPEAVHTILFRSGIKYIPKT